MNGEKEEMVDLIDENDNVIGVTTRAEQMKKNLAKRMSRVIVRNEKGEYVIHKRAATIAWPNAWDVGATETVIAGESYEHAAQRGLKEELGIAAAVKFIGKLSFEKEDVKRHCELFECYVNDEKIIPDPKEVSEFKWMSEESLRSIVNNKEEGWMDAVFVVLPYYWKHER